MTTDFWLFGDSWIGSVENGRHSSNSVLVNNTVALQWSSLGFTETQPGTPHEPKPAQFDFLWQTSTNGKSAAWIVPDSNAAKLNPAKPDEPSEPTWYWPTGGGAVVEVIGPGPRIETPGRNDRLVLFFFHVGKQPGKSGVWAFQTIGSTMLTVDKFKSRPEMWQLRQLTIPFAYGSPDAKASKALRETTWGVAALRDSDFVGDWTNEVLYIYGVRVESPVNRQLLLAKVPQQSVDDFDKWRFFAGSGKWSADIRDCKSISDGVASELSVERLHREDADWYVMVHSEPPLGNGIFIRMASRPEGPWSEPKLVYRAPETDRDKTYFAYAAKGHLCCSRPGEMLISYVVNSHDFGAMAKAASIYRPRFVTVKLDDLLPKPKRPFIYDQD